MNRRLKLAIASLLGFSTACSTVKNVPEEQTDPVDTMQIRKIDRRIMVMYGVRPARPAVVEEPEQTLPSETPAPASETPDNQPQTTQPEA